jgi:hypothetical protein
MNATSLSYVAKKSSGSVSRLSFSRSGSGMKPMLTTVVARVKAVDTCALGTKAFVVETRQLAATTKRMEAMVVKDFMVEVVVGTEEFEKL